MKRLLEFIRVRLLRREAKPSAAAVAEEKRLRDEALHIEVQKALLRREKACFEVAQEAFEEKKKVAHITPASPWTQQDQNHLKAFLLSASGQRFIRKCRTLEYANAIAGSEKQPDYSHAAGRTAGCGEMITFIVGELAVNFDKPEQVEQNAIAATHVDETEEEFVRRVSP